MPCETRLRLWSLIYNPRWANREQKGSCLLPSMLWVSQDQDIIQIYNNMKTFASAKKHISLVSKVKTPWPVTSPNGKTFHWKGLSVYHSPAHFFAPSLFSMVSALETVSVAAESSPFAISSSWCGCHYRFYTQSLGLLFSCPWVSLIQ